MATKKVYDACCRAMKKADTWHVQAPILNFIELCARL